MFLPVSAATVTSSLVVSFVYSAVVNVMSEIVEITTVVFASAAFSLPAGSVTLTVISVPAA